MAKGKGFEDVIASILGEAARKSEERDGQSPVTSTPVADQLKTYREAYTNYMLGAKGRFKPGDIVAPKKGYNIKAPGQPCLVLAVFDEPKFPEGKAAANACMSGMYDMLILREIDGELMSFLELGMSFEPYV